MKKLYYNTTANATAVTADAETYWQTTLIIIYTYI